MAKGIFFLVAFPYFSAARRAARRTPLTATHLSCAKRQKKFNSVKGKKRWYFSSVFLLRSLFFPHLKKIHCFVS